MAGREIRLSRDYPAPARIVWRALTERELITEWLMPNDFELVAGKAFTLRTDPAPGFDGVVHARLLEFEPERRMSWSWRGGPIDTMVEFHLEALGDEACRLHLAQTGFRGLPAMLVSAILHLGWRSMLRGTLARVIERVATTSR